MKPSSMSVYCCHLKVLLRKISYLLFKHSCTVHVFRFAVLISNFSVMIQPLDTSIRPRGLSFALISLNRGPLSCHFLQEPEFQYEGGDCMNRGKLDQTSLVEGAMSTCQFVDHVRHMFLGKKPYIIKECCRCAATSLPLTSHKKALNKGWDLRFSTKCPACLGPWKLSCLDENSAQKSNLISCI